ncbi:MAG: hypothetical protein IJO29_05285 [Oscillospiraceae bacterium]|nr:hypothetical protein [Oscillospiraceae bacterium]
MRITPDDFKKNAKFLICAIAALILGIFLIISAPGEYTDISDVYYTNADEYNELALTNIYPIGILGSETISGTEYTYYLFCAVDATPTRFAAVVKTANSDFAQLLESQSPVAFEGTLYGKAAALKGEPKKNFDEIAEGENLSENYAIADWCFEDSMQNIESQTTAFIFCGYLLIIAGIGMLIVFCHKLFKTEQI